VLFINLKLGVSVMGQQGLLPTGECGVLLLCRLRLLLLSKLKRHVMRCQVRPFSTVLKRAGSSIYLTVLSEKGTDIDHRVCLQYWCSSSCALYVYLAVQQQQLLGIR
jgi:hypothetical protein